MTKLYFAPLEGITGYIYRNAHHTFFGHIDKYFIPFLSPNQNRRFTSRELNDVLPEHNEGMAAVPQILTNNPENFIWAAGELKSMGYREVNLNLGCPSGTVVSKYKGSGFLARREELDLFFQTIFSKLDMEVSVKTRIGKDSPEEFYELIKLFNKYPLKELIVHPRIQKDFYNNIPNLPVFRDGLALGINPTCYNGDIGAPQDYRKFILEFPQVDRVMIGRGLLTNPGLADEIMGERPFGKEKLWNFHDMVYEGYRKTIPGERNVLFKMKELWGFMIQSFADYEKYEKKIRKAQGFAPYEEAVRGLFKDQELVLKN